MQTAVESVPRALRDQVAVNVKWDCGKAKFVKKR
jgi:hypothetical protein